MKLITSILSLIFGLGRLFAQEDYILVHVAQSRIPVTKSFADEMFTEFNAPDYKPFQFPANIIQIVYSGDDSSFVVAILAEKGLSPANKNQIEANVRNYVRWRRMGFSRAWCEKSMEVTKEDAAEAIKLQIPKKDAEAIEKTLHIPSWRIEPLEKKTSASIRALVSGRSYLIKDIKVLYLVNVYDVENKSEPICVPYALDAGELSATWAGALDEYARKLIKEIKASKKGTVHDYRAFFDMLKSRSKKTIPSWLSPNDLDPNFGW